MKALKEPIVKMSLNKSIYQTNKGETGGQISIYLLKLVGDVFRLCATTNSMPQFFLGGNRL